MLTTDEEDVANRIERENYLPLDGLLTPNGLGYVERGEFIFVYTAEEMAELQVDGFLATGHELERFGFVGDDVSPLQPHG